MCVVEVNTLEGSVERDQKMLAELCQKHAEEVNQVKKEMRAQLNTERERLLNQIRELTVIKEHTSAQVSMVHGTTIVSDYTSSAKL